METMKPAQHRGKTNGIALANMTGWYIIPTRLGLIGNTQRILYIMLTAESLLTAAAEHDETALFIAHMIIVLRFCIP